MGGLDASTGFPVKPFFGLNFPPMGIDMMPTHGFILRPMTTTSLDLLRKRLAKRKGRWPDVAEASNVPVSTVRKIAQGHTRNPRIETVDRINRALDLAERVA